MARRKNRRDFLKAGTATGLGVWVSGIAPADEAKIRFACIGVGGAGKTDMDEAAKHGDIVAICDVDSKNLDKAAGTYPPAQKFTDFREMLSNLGGKIDAVTVSTPDHTHAVAAGMALNLGKHCFCQKPLTHAVWEARRLGEIAREQKVATQMGIQGTAGDALRKAAAVVKAGALGAVKEVHVSSNRPIWAQGKRRPDNAPVPENLNWDLWLGPAKQRPFALGYHPFAWRGFWDFGVGALDMACHALNLPFMALDLRDPISIEAESSENNKEMYPSWSILRYVFPTRNKRGPVALTWYDGGKRPNAELLDGEKLEASGTLIIGEKGKLYSPGDYGATYKLLGRVTEPKVDYPNSPGHFAEFIRAIKGGPAPISNFPDYSSPLTETVLLGNVALWAGKKVEWDAKNLKAKNAPELQEIIKPVYRKGWTL